MRTILFLLLALPGAALADEVPADLQQAVIEHFRPTFVLPDLVVWQFDSATPYQLGGTLVCGHVNFPNSARVFIGKQEFYAVVRNGIYKEGGIVGDKLGDPVGAMRFAYNLLCKPKGN